MVFNIIVETSKLSFTSVNAQQNKEESNITRIDLSFP